MESEGSAIKPFISSSAESVSVLRRICAQDHKMRFIAFFLVAAALAMQADAADPEASKQTRTCVMGASRPVKDTRIQQAITNARNQHALFGGQLIGRSGGVVAVGFHEAEFDRPQVRVRPPGSESPSSGRLSMKIFRRPFDLRLEAW
jgi:hypothetical protein